MTFEEWWDECMGWIEYEPDQYNKGIAKAAWEAGMNTLAKAHQIRPRGKSITSGYVLVPVEPTESMINEFWDVVQIGKEARPSDIYKAMIQAAQEEE